MTSQSLSALVDALVVLTPGTEAAEGHQRAIEGLLMGTLHGGGRQAGEELVESLDEQGYLLERLDALPCMWRVSIPPPRILEIWFTGGDDPVVAALSYRVGKPWGSKAQKSAAKQQAEFYERYDQLDPKGRALSTDDRLIFLVGELEADVNNGGFGQYLDNKGKERVREALASLTDIGARRTSRWLTASLVASADDLHHFDQQFNENGEDLASLVMNHIRRRT